MCCGALLSFIQDFWTSNISKKIWEKKLQPFRDAIANQAELMLIRTKTEEGRGSKEVLDAKLVCHKAVFCICSITS